MQKLDEIRTELATEGIVFAFAQVRKQLGRFFAPEWMRKRNELYGSNTYPTLKNAIHAFNQRKDAKAGSLPPA
jgi:hypothetical protein